MPTDNTPTTPDTSGMLTLREAADQFGISVKTLHRRIAADALPEAVKMDTSNGLAWVIPATHLATIGQREGWAIDLTQDSDQGHGMDSVQADSLRELLATRSADNEARTVALVAAAEAEGAARLAEMKARAETAEAEAERANRRAQSLAADLDAERAELARRITEVGRLTSDVAAITARLEASETLITRADNDTTRERQRADQLTEQLAEAQRIAAMGWRERRAWRKTQRPQ